MKILYCSTLTSNKLLENLSEKIGYPLTSLTIQKFHRLIVKGLVANGCQVDSVSTSPSVSFFNNAKDDVEDGIHYHYITTIELPLIRHFCILFGVLFQTIYWHLKSKEKHFIICDVLNISVCMGAVFSRLFGVKVIGIVTDMPGLMVGIKQGLVSTIMKKINLFLLKRIDAFIFLTEAMNQPLNPEQKPYIIMEGLVDVDMQMESRLPNDKYRDVVYAGGIYEKYGLALLIEAFRKVKGDDLRLLLYGRIGDMPHDMEYYEKLDPRLHYMGIRPNSEIVQEELQATLLVNPRPSTEEFTKYSFPSKNMEYMVSGTPVLTMDLPGMPSEYDDNLFICKDESVEGLSSKLNEILSLSQEALENVGSKGKDFVLIHKNNKVQSQRILNFIYNYF